MVADKAAVAKAKKAARTAISVLMSAYKFPEVGSCCGNCGGDGVGY